MKNCFTQIRNNRGSTMLGALAAIMTAGIAGASALQLASGEMENTSNEMQSLQARNICDAGTENSLRYVNNGYSPDVNNKSFAQGTYTAVSYPEQSTLTVSCAVGKARHSQSVGTTFAKDCVTIDTADAYTDGQNLHGVKLVKTCNAAAIVTSMSIDWNWASCLEDSYAYAENEKGKTAVCHVPPGNPANEHTIYISDNAVSAHTDHGDYMGECNGASCDPYDDDLEDDGNAQVDAIHLSAATIYDGDNSIGTPALGADDEETINVLDTTLTTDGDYTFLSSDLADGIKFDTNHPGYGFYTINVTFADGSEISGVFQDSTTIGTDSEPEFEVDEGTVEVEASQTVTLEIIGSAITYGSGGPEIEVTLELGESTQNNGNGNANGTYTYSDIFNGSDVDGGETEVVTSGVGTNYRVRATALLTPFGLSNRTKDSSSNTSHVKTLVNGDQAPPLQGFGGQKPVTAFLDPYLDANGVVTLDSNQVILLFEFNNSLSSWAADFQDVVVLMTIDN